MPLYVLCGEDLNAKSLEKSHFHFECLAPQIA